MQLSTPVKLPRPANSISIGTSFLTLGSCFADRIGRKLERALFQVTTNPTGVHYNPVSLSGCFGTTFEPPDLFLHQGLWRSLLAHSSLSQTNCQDTLDTLRQAAERRTQALQTADVVLLTLGTALVWQTVGSGKVVANCHRLKESLFHRRRLSARETVDALQAPLHQWLEFSASRSVILTVSPVRYLRDGLVENSRGKAVLLLACEELERSHPRIVYFPSYEIFLDELRDYRYYADDLVQPSDLGVKIVWDSFCQTFFEPETRELLNRVEKIQTLAGHRLTQRSKPDQLGRKGLDLLDELEGSGVKLNSLALRERFHQWISGSKL